MNLEPLFARVLLRREALKKKGSILLPDAAAKRNARWRGTVVAKGPTADASIVVGEDYIFGAHAGTWINADGAPESGDEEFFVCQDEDLICRVSKEIA